MRWAVYVLDLWCDLDGVEVLLVSGRGRRPAEHASEPVGATIVGHAAADLTARHPLSGFVGVVRSLLLLFLVGVVVVGDGRVERSRERRRLRSSTARLPYGDVGRELRLRLR